MRSGGKSRPNLSPPSKFKVSPEERLSPEDLEELKQIFDLLDEDNTGKIDPNELYQLLEELGLTHRSPILNTLLNDFTKNKTLTFEEFLTLFCNRLGDTKSKGGLAKLFQLFDTDNTGYIDLANLKVAAK
jgi:centrin-1